MPILTASNEKYDNCIGRLDTSQQVLQTLNNANLKKAIQAHGFEIIQQYNESVNDSFRNIWKSNLSLRKKEKQKKARQTGLALALITRVLLLLSLSWVMSLTAPLFTVLQQEISGRDLILLIGGLFLIYKATAEIHEKLEGENHDTEIKGKVNFTSVIAQILSW